MNDAGEFVAGAELQVSRKDTGDIVETIATDSKGAVEISLPAGTYTIHESYTPDNYAGLTKDIEFTIGNDGTVKINNEEVEDIEVLNRELIHVTGTKTWTGDTEADRPASITVNLYANGTKVDTKTVTAEDDWKYDFGKLNRYDDNGNEIAYTVDEEIVRNYGKEVTNGTPSENTENNVGVLLHLTDNADIGDGTLDIYYTKDSKWYKIAVSKPIAGTTIYVPIYKFSFALEAPDKQISGILTEKMEYVSGQRPAGTELDEAPSYNFTGNMTSFNYLYPENRPRFTKM